MKVDIFKSVLAVAFSALLGYMCYLIAPEVDNQHIIAWIVCSISVAIPLVPAMGFSFPEAGNRSFSGKTYLWACFALILITNLIFSFFQHKTGSLVLVVGLEVLLAAYVAYSILKK